jgi:MoaA/NifB/PqqE/SkfB family radical SAM enzyme
MEGIKKFITLNVPVGACNFRCSYCYLSHRGNGAYHGGIRPFVREPRFIADFFSREKMGGTCYFNLCADGETSFHPQIAELIKLLLAEGHVADIITNGTNSAFFDGMISVLSAEEKKRFFVKFSFHYVQLLQKNLLETFSANVQKIKKSGISFSVEITPHDELIPFISEIKEFSLKEFGALPHITVARNDGTKQLELLSEYKKDDLKKIWGGFNSGLFDFKIGIFNERRREFCYAGLWSLAGSLETGDLFQCYIGEKIGNISDGKNLF